MHNYELKLQPPFNVYHTLGAQDSDGGFMICKYQVTPIQLEGSPHCNGLLFELGVSRLHATHAMASIVDKTVSAVRLPVLKWHQAQCVMHLSPSESLHPW